LKHAYNNSSFYRDLYSSNGIKPGDLDEVPIEKLPSTDKSMVVENFGQIITAKDIDVKDALDFVHKNRDPGQLYQKKYKIIHSSGSSGTPSVTIYSLNDLGTALACSSRMFPFQYGKKFKFAYYAGVTERFAGISFAMLTQIGFLKYAYDLLILDMNEPLENSIKALNEFKPDVLAGYGTGLAILANSQMDGKLNIRPRMALNGGEELFPQDAKLIKNAFGTQVTDYYAATECYCMAIGKEEYEGMYLMDDYCYLEIEEDYFLLTNLYNYTQPTIRYKIDDQLVLKEDRKRLLPFRLIERAIGRRDILIWLLNEKNERDYIHPIVFTSIYIKGIDKYQLVLTSETSFDLVAVLEEGSTEEEAFREARLKMDELLKTKGMTNVSYKIRSVDHPIFDKNTLKFKRVIKDY
jgi:phenylacetate-CoA ligase